MMPISRGPKLMVPTIGHELIGCKRPAHLRSPGITSSAKKLNCRRESPPRGSSTTACPSPLEQPLEHPRPVMRGAARLQPHPRRRQLAHHPDKRAAPDPPTQHRLLRIVDTVTVFR